MEQKNSENNILLVGFKNSLEEIKERISLLRSSDKFSAVEYSNAISSVMSSHFNLVILYAENNNPDVFDFMRQIGEIDFDFSSVVLIEKNCSSDFLIEMVDLGIREVIHSYLEDWEFLTRIIWAINSKTSSESSKTKNNILKKSGIIDEESGFLKEEYARDVINEKIQYSIKFKLQACILGIVQKTNVYDKDEIKKFEFLLKKSLRSDDIILKTNENYYFIFLPHTKLSQSYSLFEKLKSVFASKWEITSAIIDVYSEKVENIFETLKKELKKTEKTSGSFAILLNSSHLNEENYPQSLDLRQIEIKNEGESGLDYMEKNEIDEIFHSTYRKKTKLVIEPIFKKLKNLIDREKTSEAFVDYTISSRQSIFKIISTDDEFYLKINYNDGGKVIINTTSIINNIMEDIKPCEFELMDFSSETLSEYIENVIQNISL